MMIEIESSEEFLTLLDMLKQEGRQVFTLHHPRKSDRWLWKVDLEGPKGEKVGQLGLDLGPTMP